MALTHKRSTRSLISKSAQLALAVPQVVAHRTARLAMAGASPTARDRKEFQRMADEKTAAFAESWMAMAAQALRVNQALGLSLMRSFRKPKATMSAAEVPSRIQDAALGVLAKGLAPVHRTAVANAKRLSRAKRR